MLHVGEEQIEGADSKFNTFLSELDSVVNQSSSDEEQVYNDFSQLRNSSSYNEVKEIIEEVREHYINEVQRNGYSNLNLTTDWKYDRQSEASNALSYYFPFDYFGTSNIVNQYRNEIEAEYGNSGELASDLYIIDNLFTVLTQDVETGTIEYESSAAILQKSIATWYKVLRRVSLVGLLSVLVYVGIRIIISAPSEKSKYKKMFLNWLVAVCILFVLHYLMVLILTVSTKITEIFIEKGEPNIIVELPVNTSVDGVNLPGGKSETDEPEQATEDNPPIWSCSFTGYLRLMAGAYGEDSSIGLTNFAYAVMYLVMVIYTCMFTLMYLKRVLYMAFLTMIAPLIALTYPLDKLQDGKAQAFGMWLSEYMFNALIQPIHLILYVMIVSNVMDYVKDHPVYAIVALGFLFPADKFIRKMFGFDKQSTAGDNVANIVGGAAIMQGMNQLSAMKGANNSNNEKGTETVRTADNPIQKFDVPKIDESQSTEPEEGQPGGNESTSHSDNSNTGNNGNNDSSTNGGSSQQGGGAPRTGGNNFNFGQGSHVPSITPAKSNDNEKGFLSKIASGALNVGFEQNKRNINNKPKRLKKRSQIYRTSYGWCSIWNTCICSRSSKWRCR